MKRGVRSPPNSPVAVSIGGPSSLRETAAEHPLSSRALRGRWAGRGTCGRSAWPRWPGSKGDSRARQVRGLLWALGEAEQVLELGRCSPRRREERRLKDRKRGWAPVWPQSEPRPSHEALCAPRSPRGPWRGWVGPLFGCPAQRLGKAAGRSQPVPAGDRALNWPVFRDPDLPPGTARRCCSPGGRERGSGIFH